jgi:DNA-directed RNA polymerase specialized sigma24 family protein
MERLITNDDIQRIYKDDSYQKIMYSASRFYLNVLDSDEIESCKLKAIFLSLKNYDSSKGSSYTTYLYRGIIQECKTQAKIKGKMSLIFDADFIQSKYNDTELLELNDLIDNIEGGLLLKMKYIDMMTLEEISKELKISKQSVHERIKKAKKIAKEHLLSV